MAIVRDVQKLQIAVLEYAWWGSYFFVLVQPNQLSRRRTVLRLREAGYVSPSTLPTYSGHYGASLNGPRLAIHPASGAQGEVYLRCKLYHPRYRSLYPVSK